MNADALMDEAALRIARLASSQPEPERYLLAIRREVEKAIDDVIQAWDDETNERAEKAALEETKREAAS